MDWKLKPVEVPKDVLDEYVKRHWKKRDVGKCQFPEDIQYPCQDCKTSNDPTKCPFIGAVPVVYEPVCPANWSPMILADNVAPLPLAPATKKTKWPKAQKKKTKQAKPCKQKR